MREWQARWDGLAGADHWYGKLIHDLCVWMRRENADILEHSHQFSQFLSGHGCFNKYLKKIGKSNDDKCWFCTETDDAEHTVFKCPKWEPQRNTVNRIIGKQLNTHNLISIMTSCQENNSLIHEYVTTIIRRKEEHERIDRKN